MSLLKLALSHRVAYNGRLAADVQGLLGKIFVFVSSFAKLYSVRFESLGLHGLGCKLVMG
jgi:hypothetical protein